MSNYNMLNITGFIEAEDHVLTCDLTIPFRMEINDTASSIPLYWETGCKSGSEIQIGIHPASGALCSIVVEPIIGCTLIEDVKAPSFKHIKNDQIPVFDITEWPAAEEPEYMQKRFKRVKLPLYTYLGRDFVWFSWAVPSFSDDVCKIGNFYSGYNDQQFSGIGFFDLGFDQMTMVRANIRVGN